MKVSIIEPVGGHGGMNYYNAGLGRGLVEIGVSSTLYTSIETVETSCESFSIDKCFIGVFGSRNKLIRLVNYLRGLIYAVRKIKGNGEAFAHLHFFQYGLLELIVCLTLRVFGLAVVATVHDVESFCHGRIGFLQKTVLKLCSDFIVHNRFSKSELRSVFRQSVISKPISIIPHGNYKSYVNQVSKKTARRSLGLSDKSEILLFFGQIKDVKGLDLLIDALALVKKKKPEVILVIAGKTWKTGFSKYRQRIVERGLDESVVAHVRYIPDECVDDYYCSADVVVLPYKKIYQSGVLLMAMSYGKAVVASDLRPMREVISDGENGFLFKAEDVDDLARVIVRALSFDVSRVGEAASNTMLGDYSWESIAEKHVGIYGKYKK